MFGEGQLGEFVHRTLAFADLSQAGRLNPNRRKSLVFCHFNRKNRPHKMQANCC